MKRLLCPIFALLSTSVVLAGSRSLLETPEGSGWSYESIEDVLDDAENWLNYWDNNYDEGEAHEIDTDTKQALRMEFPNGIEEFLKSFAYKNRFTKTTLFATGILTPEEQEFANWGNGLKKEDKQLLLRILDSNTFFSTLKEAKEALEKAKTNSREQYDLYDLITFI